MAPPQHQRPGMSITAEQVAEWLALQPPPTAGAPTPAQLAQRVELAAKQKEFLKAAAEALGSSEGKVKKEIGKLAKKALAAAKPAGDPKPKAEKTKAAKKPAAAAAASEPAPEEDVEVQLKKMLPEPCDNVGYHAKGGKTLQEDPGYWKNSPEQLAEHLKVTGGKWLTRFPPEPNGYLSY